MKPRELALLACVCCLTGCGDGGHAELKQWMQDSSKDMKGRVAPLPELKPFPIVSYNAAARSDPFNPMRIDPEKKEVSGANKPDFDRPREQLEAYPLESISFIGVVRKGKTNVRHAVLLAEGVVYQAMQGNYLGQNFGRIARISDTEIVLKEIVQDPTGQTADWIERQVSLPLQEDAQGKESKK